ncbi:MAG: undecaprenyl/decaprenyl-phosphate alpha-N-acetylglucosaminyl 1-phosphate transferase [Flavobacteriales bacterium]|nr:undecaprenyl/decaprenyl-phosphate alpha-N-acetylglucosaminyl 1-phosphate transferase [Flavobacteriales bacterium]
MIIELLIAITLSFALSTLFIGQIIKMSRKFNWVDQPNERSSHQKATPTLGGIGIVSGTLITSLVFNSLGRELYLFLGLGFGLMILGIIDDKRDLKARTKIIVQLIFASIAVHYGYGLHNLHGLFGLYEISNSLTYLLSIGFIIFMINAFNLIDGIDGLAGGLGILIFATLSFVLFEMHYLEFSILCAIIAFALVGFLVFNFNPASIFMGDTGSMVLGFWMALMALKIMSEPKFEIGAYQFDTVNTLAAVLMIPIWDVFRVSFIRIMKNKKPWKADRNHLHHALIKAGCNHKIAASLMYSLYLLLFGISILLNIYFKMTYAEHILSLLIVTMLSIELINIRLMALLKHKLQETKSRFVEKVQHNILIENNLN